MIDKAANLKTYLTYLVDEKIKKVDDLLSLNSDELKEYQDLLADFKRTNSSSASTEDKGKSLESIVSFILNKSVVFEIYENVRTSTNEVDLLIRFNRRGNYLSAQGLLSFEPNFLCECKNYNKSIDVTWIGKFYSLIKVSKNSLGILFSYHGLSGNGWNHASGLVKKIYMSDEKSIKIIDFNINDFEKIANGESFISLISNKILNLENDTNIKHFISDHPNKKEVEQLLKQTP